MKQDEIIVRPFKAEDVKIVCPDIAAGWSEVNETSGPAFTAISKKYGDILGCGGIRIYGLGEPWSAYSERFKEHYKKSLYRMTLEIMNKIVTENHLWRLMATAKAGEVKAPEFLKRLGFIEDTCGMFIRENLIAKET